MNYVSVKLIVMKYLPLLVSLLISYNCFSQELILNKSDTGLIRGGTMIYDQQYRIVGIYQNPNLYPELLDHTLIELDNNLQVKIPMPRCFCGSSNILVSDKFKKIAIMSLKPPDQENNRGLNYSRYTYLYIYDFNGNKLFESDSSIVQGVDSKALISEEGDIHLAGQKDGKYFLKKIDLDGATIWDKQIPYRYINSLDVLPENNHIILNHTDSKSDIKYITVFNSEGTVVDEYSSRVLYRNIFVSDPSSFYAYSRNELVGFSLVNDKLKINTVPLDLTNEEGIYRLESIPFQDSLLLLTDAGHLYLYSKNDTDLTVPKKIIYDEIKNNIKQIHDFDLIADDKLVVYRVDGVFYYNAQF